MTNHVLALLTLSLTPMMVLLFGFLFQKRPPRDINYLFGYRTTRSMKDKETWAYAHNTVGKLWFYGGMVLELFVTMCYLLFAFLSEAPNKTLLAFLFILPLGYMLVSIIVTEFALKKRFDVKSE